MDKKQSTCTAQAVRARYTALHIAAAHSWLDVVRILVEKCGYALAYRDAKGYTALDFACYYRQIDVVKYLQSVVDQENHLPPHYALAAPMYDPSLDSQPVQNFRYTEVVKFLVFTSPLKLSLHCRTQNLFPKMVCKYMALARHCSMLEHTKYLVTEAKLYTVQACSQQPMSVVCTCGKLDNLNYLIEEGYCHRKYRKTGQSMLLHSACTLGRLDIVKYLIENSYCDPTKEGNGGISIHIASRSGEFEILKYLVEERCIDPEVYNGEGNTPLHLACMNDDLKIAEYLIVNKRCNPNVHNRRYQLPLHLACQNRSLEMVKLVSKYTLSSLINNEDSDGYTPLHYACGYDMYEYWFKTPRARKPRACTGLNLSVVSFLVEKCGCDPMKPVKFYGGAQSSLVEITCKQSNLGLLHVLTSVNVNCQDENGNSPLHLACKHNEIEIVSYLTNERKCNQTVQNAIGELPLHIACRQKSLKMVKYVSNCDINTQADTGDTPLHIACRHKALEIVRYFVQTKGCSPPHHPDTYSNLRIHVACDSEDLALVRSIATPDNVNHYYEKHDRTTPLHIACKYGNVEIVTFLVKEMHADLNIMFHVNRELPLHIACQLNSLELVQLVSGCEEVNCKDFVYGNTPLHTACKDGPLEIAKYLIEEKQCLTVIQNSQGELPLHIACQRQSLEMVKLTSNCDLNQKKNGRLHCCLHDHVGNFQYSRLGNTPLHMAFRVGAVDIVSYLIQTGNCDLTIENDEGELPIHCACKHSLELVKLTVEYCSQNLVNAKTANKVTPLHFACLYGKLCVVRFLIEEKGADCRVYDSNGLTALHYACGVYPSCKKQPSPCENTELTPVYYKCGCCFFVTTPSHDEAAVAKYLVTSCECDPMEEINRDVSHALVGEDFFVTPDSLSSTEVSPFEMAIVKGNLELVKALSSGNLNINRFNGHGESLLHIACKHEQLEVVEFLVKGKYCNQSIQNRAGELALHIVCKQNRLDFVQLVCNCDVNMKTITGETPLHIACKHCHIEIAEYLISQTSCDPTISNGDGYLPLHIACEQNSLSLVKLVSNCNVNTRAKDGATPLHMVFKQTSIKTSEKFQILTYLVSEKLCDITLPDGSNDIPIHIVCKQYYELEFVKLLTNDESVKYKDENGNTPLHNIISCYYERYEIMNFLVRANAFIVNVQNKDGDTPLHLACRSILPLAQIECLVEGKTHCDISIANNQGQLPLHVACGKKRISLKVIKLLSQGNPKVINSRKELGDTPLHIACRMQSPEIAMYLLDSQLCNVDIQNSKGELPLHIACQNAFNCIIMYLCRNINIEENTSKVPQTLPHTPCWQH